MPRSCVAPGQKVKVRLKWKRKERKGNLFVKIRRVDFYLNTKRSRIDKKYRLFKRTLLTLEYSTIDKQYELKWHGRGVGVIKEQAVTTSKELSKLVAIKR